MAVRMILLFLALGLITLATEREEVFLEKHGFGHLVDKFKEQEVTMDMMSSLSDSDFVQLGLATVGARHRFRNAINKESAENQENQGQAQEDQVQQDQNNGQVQQDQNLNQVQQDPQLGQVQQDQPLEQVHQDQNAGEIHEDQHLGQVQEDQALGQVQENQNKIIFLSTTKATGRTTHHFMDGFNKFSRNQIKNSGRALFLCSVKGCKAKMYAQYSEREKSLQDKEEPVLDQATRCEPGDHLMANGIVHPVQVIPNCTELYYTELYCTVLDYIVLNCTVHRRGCGWWRPSKLM